MRRLTRYLLWAFVFTVPWDNFPLPFVGSVSRVFGLAVIACVVLTTAMQGRFRKPDAVLTFSIAFGLWGALSLLWTLSYGSTFVLAITYLQLVASVWVIRECVRTREEVQPLLAAICLGLFVPLLSLFNNFRIGTTINPYESRFSGNGANANQIGLYLVLGLPIAWHLIMNRRGVIRVAALIYFVAAPVGLLLTATRGAFVAGLVAMTIVPLTLPRQSLRSYLLTGVMLAACALAVATVVPRANLERILGTASEVTEGGRMSGRTAIWNAGLQAFPDRPLLGAGLGAYGAAVGPYSPNRGMSAHNLALGLLVENGIVGLGLFAAVLGACAWTILHSPPPHRALWGVILLTWVAGGLSGSPESVKFTWVLFGLVAAQSGLTRTARKALAREQASRRDSDAWRAATI
ncbi:MAG: O-antigen ligase family protein [Acidobacteriota bacterium]